MREAFKKIDERLEINNLGERTFWKEGFEEGVKFAVNAFMEGKLEYIVPNNNYFVIMYHGGNKNMPYVEEMKLYKVVGAYRKHCFSRNLDATVLNTRFADVELARKTDLQKRVYLTREQAECAIERNFKL